jgi:autotransporter-associated beta strand protein
MTRRHSLLLAALMILADSPAAAQYTWTGANSNPAFINDPIDWSNPYNWSSGIPASGANTTITFASAPAGVSNNNLGPFTVNALTFNTGMQLVGSALTFPANNSVGLGTAAGVTIANGLVLSGNRLNLSGAAGTLTLSGAISGGGQVQVGFNTGGDAAFTAVLSNAGNTYGGGTTIYTLGTVRTGASGALPAGGNILVHTGTLDLNGTNQSIGNLQLTDPSDTVTPGPAVVTTGAGTLTVNGNITYNPNSAASAPGATISGNLNLGAINRTLSIAIASAPLYDMVINAPISGSGGFTKTGTGYLALTRGVTNTGPVTLNDGIIYLGVTNALSNAVVVNGGHLHLNPSTTQGVTGGNYDQTFGSLAGSAGDVQLGSATLTVGTDNTTTSYAGLLTSSGGAIVKVGTGALTLSGNSAFTYIGSMTVTGGVLAVTADNALGGAGLTINSPLTINPAGTLRYTASATTSRTFALSGTLEAPAGATLTLSGAAVNGGFMRGAGAYAVTGGTALIGVTTASSATLNVTGPGSFVNFTNGGAFNVSAGSAAPASFNLFTNQGSGAITVGAASKINAADFQSYGLLTVNPAASTPPTLLTNTGTSPMFFNGGSRTFIGTPATATASPAVAGVDLHGQNLVVAGGLFVNNGFVADSTGTPGGVIVDFGALYKGAGTNFVNVVTQNGGRVQAGNSPGSMGFGRFVFGPGGVNNYVFSIDDASGKAGPSPDALGHVSGWGLVKAVKQQFGATTSNGDFVWTATPSSKLTVAIDTLVNPTTVGADVPGMMDHFDPNSAYSWPAVQWAGTYSGPTDVSMLDAATSFDISGFVNPVAGTFGWTLGGSSLSLTYAPSAVPEPGTLLLCAFAAVGFAWRRRGSRFDCARR